MIGIGCVDAAHKGVNEHVVYFIAKAPRGYSLVKKELKTCNEYIKLYSKRQDVWDGIAYQTTGCLNKNDLSINKNGKITSKKKSIYEIINNKFVIHGVNIS